MVEMARWRRGAGLAATVLLGATALAACGGDAEDDGTLKMVVWGGDAEKANYQARIDLFEAANPDTEIDLQLIPSEQYEQKVQTMIAGGDGPDIMQVAENVNSYSSKAQLVPLDEYIESAGLDMNQRFGPAGDLYKYEDQTYAIPDRSGAMVVFYNKDLFDAAGVEYPTAEWSQEDAEAAMGRLTDPAANQWGYGGAGWWAQWWSFAYQNGGQIIGDDGQPTANSPEVVEGLQWANDLQYQDHYAPTAAEYADMGPDMGGDQAFAAQTVAINTTGFWGIIGLKEADFNWGIAPMWHGAEQAVSGFGSGLAVTRDAENPQQAFGAIDFLTDTEAQTVIIDQALDVPANLEVQQSDAFLKPSWAPEGLNMGAFGESSEFIFRAPFIPQWNEMMAAFDDNLGTFWNEGGDAKAELDKVQTQLESIIE